MYREIAAKNARGRAPTWWALCSSVLILAYGCASTHGSSGPSTSTETGNPPVIDGKRITLVISGDKLEVSGSEGAVTPGGSTIEVTNERTGDSVVTKAAGNGAFETELPGTAGDPITVRVTAGGKTSKEELTATAADAGSDAQQQHPSSLDCWAREERAATQLSSALAAADVTCRVDADCAIANIALSCKESCQPEEVMSKAAVAAVEEAVAHVESTACMYFNQANCATLIKAGPCDAPLTGLPVCDNGTCVRKDDPEGCGRCSPESIDWGPNGGNVAFADRSLLACTEYARQRLKSGEMTEVMRCDATLELCGESGSANAVRAAIANADVQAALAASPVLYGIDTRFGDRPIDTINIGRRSIGIGLACDDPMAAAWGPPARPRRCLAVPAGVQALRDVLQAIDSAFDRTACMAFVP